VLSLAAALSAPVIWTDYCQKMPKNFPHNYLGVKPFLSYLYSTKDVTHHQHSRVVFLTTVCDCHSVQHIHCCTYNTCSQQRWQFTTLHGKKCNGNVLTNSDADGTAVDTAYVKSVCCDIALHVVHSTETQVTNSKLKKKRPEQWTRHCSMQTASIQKSHCLMHGCGITGTSSAKLHDSNYIICLEHPSQLTHVSHNSQDTVCSCMSPPDVCNYCTP